MIETKPTLGSIETSHSTKRKLAAQSLRYNMQNTPMFRKLFPDYVARYELEKHQHPVSAAMVPPRPSEASGAIFAVGAGLVALCSIALAMRFL